ncbi:MAG: TonB-dependent receptor [Bacteroidales bacterium]|nr:TonB-dependent receptor [Bacteroidales bacterium]
MKKISLILILLITFSTITFAQKGILRGQVTDKTTGEPLIGATVIVINSEPMIGAVTDYDGNFSIENVPEGNQKIQYSFISFQKQIIETEITSKDVKIINLSLEPEEQTINQVVISARAITNTDNSLLAMQKSSVSQINGISSQSISSMGDSDVASAIKRVTGVTVESGKYIFVRGLSDRYSKITLNGAEIPGLDPNKNTVQLDLFSSNIIDNIVVHKTFSPDLPASFAGGYVNITTKSFPNKFTLQFTTSLGYNPQTNLNNNFISYDSGKKSLLGIADESLAIPYQAANDIPYLYTDNNKLDAISASFNNIMAPTKKQSFINHSHSFSIGNQIKLFSKPFGFIVDLSYSRNFQYYDNGKYSRYNLVSDQISSQGVMNPLLLEKETLGDEEIITSALVGLSYKLTPFHKIGLTLMRNGGALISTRYKEGTKLEDNMYMYENTLGFQQRSFNSVQLNGQHVLNNEKKSKIDWTSSYTKSILNEPDLRFFNYNSTDDGNYKISYSAYPAPARFYRNLTESNFDNKFNVSLPFEHFKLKFGGSYTLKSRNSISNKYDILSQDLDFNGNIEDYLSISNIGQNATDAVYGVYYQNDPITDKYNSYSAKENLAGAYLMTEFNLSEKLKVQTGVRYEYDYTFIENLVDTYHPKYVKAEKVYDTDFLPSININYSVLTNMNLRFAYSRTLARPAFREIAPYAYFDFKEGWRVVGNPYLERSMIDNIDLRWERIIDNGQIISISIFSKYFTKPIELVDDPRANNPELHYVNAENSFLYGVELELRKSLDFISLKDFMFGSNFTILKSQVKYVDDYGSTAELVVNRPMYGQSPWVVNMFLNYNNENIGLNSNLGFNVDGPKLSVVTKGETPDVYQQPVAALNYNIAKEFGKHFIIKLSVDNILNSENKKTYTYDDKEYVFQSFSLGRTYSFSIKYHIN